jgi:hypothetical protein
LRAPKRISGSLALLLDRPQPIGFVLVGIRTCRRRHQLCTFAAYRIRRPYALKIGKNQFEYVETALRHFTVDDYIQINGQIKSSDFDPYTQHGKYYNSEFDAFLKMSIGESYGKNADATHWVEAKRKFEGLLRAMLIENFFRQKIRRRYSLTLCIVLSLIGYFLLLVPSADLFLKVMSVVFDHRM